jgi:hypothetical protein
MVKFCWIKSHCGISGNEYVDYQAKQACIHGEDMIILAPETDMYVEIRRKVYDIFSEEYKSNQTGKLYKKLNPTPPKQQWFKGLGLNKEMTTCFGRLRSNHGLFPAYKAKLKIITDPNCECGLTDDVEHYIFLCQLHKVDRIKYLDEIYKTNIIKPIDLYSIIFSRNLHIIKLTYS